MSSQSPKQIYCIVKTTAQEYYQSKPDLSDKFPGLTTSMKKRIAQSHANHHKLLEYFTQLCVEFGISLQLVPENEIDNFSPRQDDPIFSFGGDGTFLSCAMRFLVNPIIGINSDYRRIDSSKGSYGALTTLNFINLKKGLKKIAEGKYGIEEWHRLNVKINGKSVEKYAVNDIYIGNQRAYKTSDLTTKVEKQYENFLCSGIVCCTGMGSHAWHKAAGGSPFSNSIKTFGFIVLAPNPKKKYQYTSGIISGENSIEIRPNRPDYVVNFDSSDDCIPLTIGDVISITLSKKFPVKVIVP